MLPKRPLYAGTPSVYVHSYMLLNSKHYHIDHTLWSTKCLWLFSLIMGEFFLKENSYMVSELGEIIVTSRSRPYLLQHHSLNLE